MTNVRISLIVPIHNAAAFLVRLIPSLAEQPNRGFEVLFVDDRSTDEGPALAKDLGEKHGLRLKVLSSSRPGPGHARNEGVEHARGHFVAFLDADDVIDLVGLEVLAKRLDDEGGALCVFNHERLYPDGKRRPNAQSALLRELGPCVTSEEGKARLLDNFNVCWNKLYRRSFLEDGHIRCLDGIYEDVPWSAQVLATARTILVSDEVLYTYCCHQSSTLRGGGEQHLALLLKYQRALDMLEAFEPRPSRLIDKIARKAVSHAFFVAYKTLRLDYVMRGRMFAQIREFVGRNGLPIQRGTIKLRRTEYVALKLGTRIPLELRRLVKRVHLR